MARNIIRIGVYWYPPRKLKDAMEKTWRGELNERRPDNSPDPCELVSNHCGDCPIWGSHATLLDAISILESDRASFVRAMRKTLRQALPLEVGTPVLWGQWPPHVFIRWADKRKRDQVKALRKRLMQEATRYAAVEQVSWEVYNDLDRVVNAMGMAAQCEFRKALCGLEDILRSTKPLRLIHAPNMPLDWYVRAKLVVGKPIEDLKLPFPLQPHMSLATAVRADDKHLMSAKEVGEYIVRELPSVPAWKDALASGVPHVIEHAYVVQPAAPPARPLEVTVLDRISGTPRCELRLPWVQKERLP